jgi:hypothetical protein
MTDEERTGDAGELIEDLGAPAEAQGEVAGGYNACVTPTCKVNTLAVLCHEPTCRDTQYLCEGSTDKIVLYEA